MFEYNAAIAGIEALHNPQDKKFNGLTEDDIDELRQLIDKKG